MAGSLFALGNKTQTLYVDNVGHGLSDNLGFSRKHEVANISRTTQVAKLTINNNLVMGLVVIFSSDFKRLCAIQII
jgi:adenylylsulfate kinase-like enzyme